MLLIVILLPTVKGSFSNKRFRSRKRRSSSENSTESCAHRSRNCSEIWEPLRKSRRLSENTACLCQRDSSEPDEVNATDETMASSEETVTLSVEKLPSLDPPELTKGVTGEKTTAINESEITTSTCNVAVASELATAEEASSEHDGTVPMKKRTYMDLRELTAGVDEDDATVIAAIGITSSSCNFTVASELATAEEASSEHDGTMPMKKRTYMDLRELTAGVDEDDATVIAAIGITSSSCNFTVASELATAEEASSEHDGTVPMKKRTYMDLRELTAGVDEDDTTVIDAIGITSSSCNFTVASELATVEEKVSGINITLPLEKCSALDVHESSEVLRTEESTNVYESEITASSHNVITGRDLLIAADDYFEGNTSLSVDKVFLVDGPGPGPAEVIATDGTTSKDETEIAASLNNVSVAPQGFFEDDGSAEDVTLPVEKVSSLDVLKLAAAIATDETPVTDESEVTSSIHGVSAASEDLVLGEKTSEAYVTLPVEKLSLLKVHHGPVEFVATGETANLDEVEITACAYDGGVITAEKGLSEDTTLPVEDITSPEVHQPTMSVTTDEITSLEGNKIAESICDVALAVQRHFQEKVSSLDVHEPANAVATNETTTPDDSKINAHNYDLNATCKHLVTPLVTLGVCWFHCDTCMGSFLFSFLYSRISESF